MYLEWKIMNLPESINLLAKGGFALKMRRSPAAGQGLQDREKSLEISVPTNRIF